MTGDPSIFAKLFVPAAAVTFLLMIAFAAKRRWFLATWCAASCAVAVAAIRWLW